MAELTIKAVTKTFADTQVLKGVTLNIADGEFVSLVGPSGCGKSTLLRIVAGLESQTTGDVRIAGQSVVGVRAADRNLSMVFQSYALYPHLTVAENIAVPLRMRLLTTAQRFPLVGRFIGNAKTRNENIKVRIKEAAEALEIDHLADRKPGQLSGGQRQRVALARALVRDPAAFLLDEPLSNLDAKLRVQTRTEIAELHRSLGATFIYVTHDQVEAMTMSDRIAVMMGGEILQCAAPDVVYNDPDDIRVAEFIGSPKINILPADTAEGGRLSVCGHVLPLQVARAHVGLRVGLRPEKLVLDGADAPVTGTVAHLENLGSELYAQIEVPGLGSRLILRAMPQDAARLRPGTIVGISFDPRDALVFDAIGKRLRDLQETAIPADREIA